MREIKVNKIIWDAASETDKEIIVTHLRQYGVLKPDQQIVADAHTPLPAVRCHINKESIDGDSIQALGIDWMCRAICDSTKAETNCSLYGQSLPSCLGSISATRVAYQAETRKHQDCSA